VLRIILVAATGRQVWIGTYLGNKAFRGWFLFGVGKPGVDAHVVDRAFPI
jgi:hypothetical protein